ncbi:MAG: ATP-binding protein [Deltaproteobacteria bacterium]
MKGLESIFDGLDAGLLLINREHCVEWMNKKAGQMLGSFIDPGKRRRCYRTVMCNEEFCAICPTGRTIDGGVPVHYEFTPPQAVFFNASGCAERREFEIIGIPVFDDGGRVFKVLEIVMDGAGRAADRVKSADVIAQIEKMAAIGHLAAGVAHELNTPLATVSIISQELRCVMSGAISGGERLWSDKVADYFADMDGELKRCQAIISDLLGFAKKGVPEYVETDLNGLVSKATSLIQMGAGYSNVAVLKELHAGMPLVKTDPNRLRQVVFNVLKNAMEAVKDARDGMVIAASALDGLFASVMIRDNGPGIPEENLKKVFDPFFTTKPPGMGTGLGLSVSYEIMKELRGEIIIDSRVEDDGRGRKGTTVTLRIPIQ